MEKEEDEVLQREITKMKSESFIERLRLKEYNSKNYLISTLRFSIIEKLLTKYLFQNCGSNKDFSLLPLSQKFAKDKTNEDIKYFKGYLDMFIEIFGPESPLYFYNQLSKEILRIFSKDDLTKISFDDYILKLEFLLAWHFENNFYPRTSIFQIIENVNDNVYLSNGITNYFYSVESIYTIEKFIKILEKQTLCSRIKKDIDLINNLFCNEKIYYFFCEKNNKPKLECGNIIKYLLKQLNTKISKNKGRKINSCELENYIMINLFLIDKIIQNYPFYFYKEPELPEIFESLELFKTFPTPISNYCNRLMETIVNENSFQGISLLNKLRQQYYLDILDNDITIIDTSKFKYTLVTYSILWEKERKQEKNANYFNVEKFMEYLKDKPNGKKNKKIILKEMLIKLFITFFFNSPQNFNDETLKKLYGLYMPNYSSAYDEGKNAGIDKDKVKGSLEKIFNVIDSGMDKTVIDFAKEINMFSKKIISTATANTKTNAANKGDNIYQNDFFLPIDSLRNYLKPNYTEFKPLSKDDNNSESQPESLNIFDSYIKNFKEIVNTYFKYFLTTPKDQEINQNLDKMRRNFFQNYHLNLLIFEEENSINDLIENLQNKIFKVLDTKIPDEDFNNFWKYFADSKKDIIPKFLLYIVPFYERSLSNPFKILTEENTLKNKENYLSEFIANHDYIYKNIIFMPFASSCDGVLCHNINKATMTTEDLMREPDIKTMYSPLRKCLNNYLGDSAGIFELDLYKVTINDKIEKIFFKNIEILDVINEENKQTKITMTCVDELGIEYKIKDEIDLGNNDFDIKIFNLFYKNNVPFNYNMVSNKGWLEMFLDDKYDIAEVDKFCNFQQFLEYNKESKFYDEFNLPTTDIESRFKNYKIKDIIIESNSPTMIIRCDDYVDINYTEKIEMDQNSSELNLKIKIEPFCVNDKRYSIPIATFTTI